jgi:hypothetical protein
MPPQWSTCVQAEGKEYIYRDSGLPFVTEARKYDPKTANKVCAWATEVERQAKNQGLILDSLRNMELFLEIDENITAATAWLTAILFFFFWLT